MPSDSAILGSYLPHGLALCLHAALSSKRIDGAIALGRDRTYRVLLHEYQHYLQDSTTLAGLIALLAFWESLYSVVVMNSGTDRISLPLRTGGQIGTPLSRFYKRYLDRISGDSVPHGFAEKESFSVKTIKCKHSYVHYPATSGMTRQKIPEVIISVEQKKGEQKYRFGSRAVRESLAHFLDEGLVRAVPESGPIRNPRFPYNAVKILSDHYATTMHSTTLENATLVRIADHALMTPYPGYFAARYIKQQAQNPHQSTELTVAQVNHAENLDVANEVGRALADFRQHFQHMSSSSKKQDMLLWFKNHFEKGLALRQCKPDFFVRPHLSSDPWAACKRLLAQFPMPLILDEGLQLFVLDSGGIGNDCTRLIWADTALYFRALRFVVGLHTERARPIACPFRRTCVLPFKSDACRQTPWVHADRDQTCAVGSAFAALHVKNKPVCTSWGSPGS